MANEHELQVHHFFIAIRTKFIPANTQILKGKNLLVLF